MKGPSGQAKLLFLYLLRSSASALATTDAKIAGEGHICLRLARRGDVSSIQRCNLATLPENYSAQYYTTHMRQWPDLALVAEHVLPRDQQKTLTFGGENEPNIVGYVLGKVEDWLVPPPVVIPPGITDLNADEIGELQKAQITKVRESRGHVTSLAVLQGYRRRGLAAALMNQLHCHMEQSHAASGVGLHVRISNSAATDLYQRGGYKVEEVIPCYYQDGEDAYYMKKTLSPTLRKQWRFGRPKPWETEEWKLPRTVWQPDEIGTTVEQEAEVAAISTSAL